MPIVIKHRFKHQCELPRETLQDIQLYTPFDRWYHQLASWIREKFSPKQNDRSFRYYRSLAAFNRERRRHLLVRDYRWVIHPCSNFLFRKNIFISFIWYLLLLADYFVYFILSTEQEQDKYLKMYKATIHFGQFFVFFDIISRFFTGYTESRTRTVILERPKIVRRYLKTYFVVDAIPFLLHLSFDFLVLKPPGSIFFVMQLLRLGRMWTILKNLNYFLNYFKTEATGTAICILGFVGFTFLHVCVGFSGQIIYFSDLFDIGDNDWVHVLFEESGIKASDESPITLYMLHMCLVMSHVVGAGNYRLTYSAPRFYFSFVLMISMMYTIICFAVILNMFSVVNLSETKYDQVMIELEQFMFHEEYPNFLKMRIFEHYDQKFDKRFFNEQKILDVFTEHMRMEVLLYSCQNLIAQVQVFRGLSKAATGTVLALLKQELYLKKDMIMRPGEQTGNLYFILYGTCGIFTTAGKEVMHVEDGDYFGDTGKFEDAETRTDYSVVALEKTEVYILEKKDLVYCLGVHPEIEHKLNAMIQSKALMYHVIFALRDDAEDTTGDIIQELRKGKIVRAGIRRIDFS